MSKLMACVLAVLILLVTGIVLLIHNVRRQTQEVTVQTIKVVMWGGGMIGAAMRQGDSVAYQVWEREAE